MLHGDMADIAAVYEQRDRELALARMRSAPKKRLMRTIMATAIAWTVGRSSPRPG